MRQIRGEKELNNIGINSVSTLICNEMNPSTLHKAVIFFHSDLKVSSINAGAEKMLEVSRGNANGKYLQDIICKDIYESILSDIFFVIKTDEFVQKDFHLSQQNMHWLRCFVFPNENDRYILLLFDITEERNRKDTENSLIAKKERAEKASETKSNFLAMLSHEIRTPLNSIMGYGQILHEDKEDPLTPRQKVKMKRIVDSSRHLLKLINNILELIRIDTKSQVEKSKLLPVNIQKVVDECLQTNKELAAEKHIAITKAKNAQNVSVEIDPIRFGQVLENLLINAIKYNIPGGKVSLYWRLHGNDFLLFVKDTGIGIDEAFLDKIFEPFFRIPSKGSDVEGTGIGLTLVKQNILEMNGTLGVYSKQGEGSTFWIKVPVISSHGKEPPLSEAN